MQQYYTHTHTYFSSVVTLCHQIHRLSLQHPFYEPLWTNTHKLSVKNSPLQAHTSTSSPIRHKLIISSQFSCYGWCIWHKYTEKTLHPRRPILHYTHTRSGEWERVRVERKSVSVWHWSPYSVTCVCMEKALCVWQCVCVWEYHYNMCGGCVTGYGPEGREGLKLALRINKCITQLSGSTQKSIHTQELSPTPTSPTLLHRIRTLHQHHHHHHYCIVLTLTWPFFHQLSKL